MAAVPGAVDVSVEQQVDVPQLTVTFDRERIDRYGLRAGALAETVEAAFAGHKVTELLEGQRTYPIVVRYRDEQRASREAIASALIDTPSGAKVPLRALADLRDDAGPNTITRENVQRKLVIQANRNGFFYAIDRSSGVSSFARRTSAYRLRKEASASRSTTVGATKQVVPLG